MTQYSKPAVRNAWAQNAGAADLQDPGNTYAQAGWQIGVKPPRQYFNWVLNWVANGIRYSCQRGIPDWDPAETYYPGATALSPNGLLCRCTTLNSNNNPDVGVFWDVPLVPTAPAGDNTPRVANTSWVHSYFMPAGAPFSFISGQIGASQVPVGAVTQWQGSLSIGGAQVTSAVARANTWLLGNTGNYVQPQWSGQSGQPSWLFGSNDGANILVWNPANFSVANANTLGGLAPTVAAAGSSIVARDASGYIYTPYYNQSSANNENPAISQFMVTNGADNFLRKASVAAVQAALGTLTTANFPALLSANGYQKFPTGVILQWGSAFISGTTTVTFPITFPNGIARVAFVNASNTNQLILNGIAGASSFSVTNGSATISWIAMGN